MSWTNLRSDVAEQKKHITESTRAGMYGLHTPLNCGTCFQTNPAIIMQKTGVSLQDNVAWRFYDGPVDVESDLLGITRPATKYPAGKYLPTCQNCKRIYQEQSSFQNNIPLCPDCFSGKITLTKNCGDSSLVNFKDCHFPVEYSRLTCPPREVGINRFQPLFNNPQENTFLGNNVQIPSRLVMKDNFKPCVVIPAINAMLPEPREMPQPTIYPPAGNFTNPMYLYDIYG